MFSVLPKGIGIFTAAKILETDIEIILKEKLQNKNINIY